MSDQTNPINVAIIGGGFGGLALLIGLQKYPHINAHVYESAQEFSEVGAGVVLGPNSQRAMALIDPRILEGYNRRAAFDVGEPDENGLHPWMTILDGHSDTVEEMFQFKHKQRGSTIHRAHFLDELVKLLEPDRAHFGKRLDEIRENGDKSPLVLHFKDNTIAEADLIIGADGIHSTVRKYILGADHPASRPFFTGAVQYRATIPIEKAVAVLGNVDQKIGLRCGKEGTVFSVPLSNKTLLYVVATVFNVENWTQDLWVQNADVSGIAARFGDWNEYVRKLVHLLPNDGSTMAWSLWQMPPAPTYYNGRVAILGDAAHACTPFQGAGAGQAIEDALVMERLLGKAFHPTERRYPTEVITQAAFQAFDSVRRFRSQKVVTTSFESGQILSSNIPGKDTKMTSLSQFLSGRQDWIWDCDQEQQVKDTMQLFDSIRHAAEFAAAQNSPT